MMTGFCVDCYLAVLKRFEERYPGARFEIVTRTSNSSLSPSRELLRDLKDGRVPWEEYLKRLKVEIDGRPEAKLLIEDLVNDARKRLVFLVCYEKDPARCHRSFLKAMMEGNAQKNNIDDEQHRTVDQL